MITVALVGLDGAGKTTVARRLARELPVPVEYLYMGVSAASSNRMLPTTRLARRLKAARRRPSGPAASETAPGGAGAAARTPHPLGRAGLPLRRARALVLGALRLANRLAEEAYRHVLAWRYRRRGAVVVLDRDFLFDYYATDVAAPGPRPLGRRVHGFVLRHLYPRADLVVYLDAAPEVVLARKGEGTLETLGRRREEYRQALGLARRSAIVDATRPLDEVTREVADLILTTLDARRRRGQRR